MSRRHRMLFVSSRYLLPADSGGKIRTVNVLRGMKGGAFDITLVSPLPANPREAAAHGAEIDRICDNFVGWSPKTRSGLFHWARMRHIFASLPVAVATDGSAPGRRVVSQAIAVTKPALLVVDFPHAAVLAPAPYPCASVLFTHNVESEIFRRHAEIARDPTTRAIWRNQAAKMDRYERKVLRTFTSVVAVAERDRDFFRTAYGVGDVSVIPTGVDLDYFAYAPPRLTTEVDGGTVIFIGSMDWSANVDAVAHLMDDVWPRVAGIRPRARCMIVGRSPPAGLVQRARGRRLNWEFTGFVNDVRPYVRQADVCVIPLRVGGGTRIKVFEAMAMGCPMVSTAIGVEGLPVVDGRHYIRSDTSEAMAESILALLGNASLRGGLSRDARKFVAAGMSFDRTSAIFEEICVRAVQSHGAASTGLGTQDSLVKKPVPGSEGTVANV